MSSMPILPVNTMVADCNEDDAWIVRKACTTRGVSEGGRLRVNKPFRRVNSFREGCANYVWRMLCFDLAGHGKHACMPVSADFELYDSVDIQYGRPERGDCEGSAARRVRVRELMKSLDELVKQVERVLPVESKKGIMRWGRALGMV